MKNHRSATQLDRDRGMRRVSHLTRWTAATGAAAVALIGVVVAQGSASASATTEDPAPTILPDTSSSPTPQPQPFSAPSPDDQGLLPPTEAPQISRHSRSHVTSGAS